METIVKVRETVGQCLVVENLRRTGGRGSRLTYQLRRRTTNSSDGIAQNFKAFSARPSRCLDFSVSGRFFFRALILDDA